MAFVVEDGTGLPAANAYLTVADFRSYHEDRGTDVSDYTDSQVEKAIVRATDYIDLRFNSKFRGYRQFTTQSLEWPRISAFYPDGRGAYGVPVEVRRSTAEYALRSLATALAPDPTYDASNGVVLERDEQVGPVRERYVFGSGGAIQSFRKYPLADGLLQPLLYAGGELMRV